MVLGLHLWPNCTPNLFPAGRHLGTTIPGPGRSEHAGRVAVRTPPERGRAVSTRSPDSLLIEYDAICGGVGLMVTNEVDCIPRWGRNSFPTS